MRNSKLNNLPTKLLLLPLFASICGCGGSAHPPAGAIPGSQPGATSNSNSATSSSTGTTSNSTGHFDTHPPASTLPTDSDCTAKIRYSSWEPRPDNDAANHTTGITGVVVTDASSSWNAKFAARINGSFTGTTDEILQWGACKWGLDEDIQRARAVQESTWHQSTEGDYTTNPTLCSSFGQSAPCYQSYGLLQIKASDYLGTYPMSQHSTPFNVDYSLAQLRACFDGDMTWLGSQPSSTRPYTAGDIWGCVGAWYSGSWYDSGAQDYISKVQNYYNTKPWLQPGF